MYKLYDYAPSGNAYKIRLLLAQLGIPFDRIPVDPLRGETRTPEFLALSPAGRVPVLLAADGTVYRESNAILLWIAKGTPYLPADDDAVVRVMEALFFEQNQIEPNFGTPRMWLSYSHPGGEESGRVGECHRAGARALEFLEQHFAREPYIVGDSYTVADIAHYAFLHVADQAGHDLTPFPRVNEWLGRVAAEPYHVTIDA